MNDRSKLATFFAILLFGMSACSNTEEGASVPELLVNGEPVSDLPQSEPYVWCGDFIEGNGVPAVHIALWPLLDPGYQWDQENPGSSIDGWAISARLSDIEPDRPIDLPLQWEAEIVNKAAVWASLNPNEYSSSTGSGTITFTDMPCVDGNDTVKLSIDATLTDELGEPGTVDILGSFNGRINEPPRRDLYGN